MRAVAVSVCALAACISKPPSPESLICPNFGPWSEPVELANLKQTNSFQLSPWLSFDGTELWYTETDGGSIQRLMRTVRDDRAQPFPAGANITDQLSETTDDDASVFVANGGLELWFDHKRTTEVIRIERRTDLTQPFGPSMDADVSGDGMFDATDATLTADEETLIYSRAVTHGKPDLWIATRPSRDATFGAGMPLDSLNTPDEECCATLSADGNALWFASGRLGNFKVYKTTRPGAGAAFADPVPLEKQDLAGGVDNTGPAISFDGRTLIFTRNSVLQQMQRDCL